MSPLIALVPVAALATVFVFMSRREGSPQDLGAGQDTILSGAGRVQRATAAGLLPQGAQNLGFPCPPPFGTGIALKAARAGDWRPAAALLASTGTDRAGRDLRARLTRILSDQAARDDDWLTSWEQAHPEDPHAALVRARGTVERAWRLRGSARAKHTSARQFGSFHATLHQARHAVALAARLNPDDATPLAAEIWVALGLGYPHAEMERVWAEVLARDPYHFDAHYGALQYWTEKWRGSRELAYAFAGRAAASAPAGSLLTVLPLIARIEHQERPSAYRSREMRALTDAVLADVAAARAGNPYLPEARHLLAHALTLQRRYPLALEQFRHVDGCVGALPWRYHPEPAAYYCAVRDLALRRAGRRARKPAAPAAPAAR